jgi:hypothetical protein
MGLNLVRERFSDWLEGYGPDSRREYLARLQQHVGRKIDVDGWQLEDTEFPRVGSYTSYGIFRQCLQFVTRGDYGEELAADEDIELEALREFRRRLRPASLKVRYAAHFLGTGDTDTIFIPVLFAKPFEYDERFVASLPAAARALEDFARGLKFELIADPETEHEAENGQWLPVSTAKNVARILYRFFNEKPDACVALS